MVKYIAEKLGGELVNSHTIEEEQKELYVFGIQLAIHIFFCLTLFLLLGLLLQQVYQTILFMIFFIPLRKYAGGFHANTRGACYIYSTLLCLGALLLIKYVHVNNLMRLAIVFLTGLVVFILAPSDTSEREMDLSETAHYKKIARIILIVESIFLLIVYTLKLPQIESCILASFIAVTGLIIICEIKNCALHN